MFRLIVIGLVVLAVLVTFPLLLAGFVLWGLWWLLRRT